MEDNRGCFQTLLSICIFPGIPMFIFVLVVGTIVTLGFMHDTDPKAYNEQIKEALGLSGGSWYQLPTDAESQIISLGFDPAIVANEIMANRWVNDNGGEIDMGIQLSILEGESQGGQNIGSCSGLASAATFSQQEVDSARWLLQYWKSHNVRDWSEIARTAILADYSDYTGHCSAGEIGPNGILPSTGVKICRDGLSSHDDSLVRSCNFFDMRVAPYGKTWWLKAIGYRAGQTKDEKIKSLYGWNHSEPYRLQLVQRASELNTLVSDWSFNPQQKDSYVFKGGWLKSIAVKILRQIGLLDADVYAAEIRQEEGTVPNVVVDGFSNPYPGGFTCGYSYGQPVGNGIHWGIDLCIGNPWKSEPVYAMHSGKVTFARYLSPSESLAGQWGISGNVIAIDGQDESGNAIWTAYGHGTDGTMLVQVGDTVEAGQLLMMSGTTGFSSGIHLHLAMKINSGWVNPLAYIGGG